MRYTGVAAVITEALCVEMTRAESSYSAVFRIKRVATRKSPSRVLLLIIYYSHGSSLWLVVLS
jgi:hypothetical protein